MAPTEPKRLATLTARAALVGAVLHRIEGDLTPEVFVVSKWAMTRQFTDLEEVERVLDLMAGDRPEVVA